MNQGTKQAILLMVHKNQWQIENLIHCLDYSGFDFYVHVDRRAQGLDLAHIAEVPKRSRITFIDQSPLYWGGASLVRCALSLLNAAKIGGTYKMFHLLSGQDMPLKPAEQIWNWFDCRCSQQFIGLFHSSLDNSLTPDDEMRYKCYYPFERMGRNFIWVKAGMELLRLQYRLGFNRVRKTDLTFGKGSQFWSISDEFAQWLLDREDLIQRVFCDRTFCCDEVFMQTMLLSSPFAGQLYRNEDEPYAQNARLMDWSRREGSGPHVWRIEDKDQLSSAWQMFARKFDPAIDKEIINWLTDKVAS